MKLMHESELIPNTRSQIVDRLRADVLSGRLEPEQLLRQEELVARFRVSRTPIREALIHLVQEGLLETVPSGRVKVRRRTPNHIWAFLTPLRRTIEVYALDTCFDELTSDDFAVWDSILLKLRMACQERDYPKIAEHEIAFHRSVLCMAGEPTLLTIWGLIVSQVAAFFCDTHRTYKDPMEIYREHEELVSTFRCGDKAASTQLYAKAIGTVPQLKAAARKSHHVNNSLKLNCAAMGPNDVFQIEIIADAHSMFPSL